MNSLKQYGLSAALILLAVCDLSGLVTAESSVAVYSVVAAALVAAVQLGISKLPAETQAKLQQLRTLLQRLGERFPPSSPPPLQPARGLAGAGVMLLVLCVIGCDAPSAEQPEPQIVRFPRLRERWEQRKNDQVPPVDPIPPAARTVSVPVYRHSSVSLTDSEADRILADMGNVLQESDGNGDVPTSIRFVRSGAVQLLPAGIAGVIQTEGQFDALMEAPAGVKVVRAIQWCGGPGGSIIGCAPLPSTRVNIAVVRFDSSMEGQLWAHEFGHNCGLNHRTNDSRAVMYPSISPTGRVVNSIESHHFLTGPTAATLRAMPACQDCQALIAPRDVREVVRQHWVHGVPREFAEHYTAADAAVLVAMLQNPGADEPYLAQVVQLLCWIGDASTVEPLLAFVRQPTARPEALQAKHAAAIHLGELLRRTGDQRVKQFLEQLAGNGATTRAAVAAPAGSRPAAAMAGVSPPSVGDLAAELATSAAAGLQLAE